MVAVQIGIKNRGAMVVVTSVDDRRILLRVGAGTIVDKDVRDRTCIRPITRTVDEVEVSVIIDIKGGERTHLIARGDTAFELLGEASERLGASRIRVVGGGVACI